jgi:hypothetical protein
MRHLRTMSVAVLTALALVACAGTTTASATRLCDDNSFAACNAADIFPATSSVVAAATNFRATTTGGLINPVYTCTSSNLTVRTTSAGGGAGVTVPGTIDAFSWSGCTDSLRACGTSATVTGLGGAASFVWTAAFSGTVTLGPAFPTYSFTCRVGSGSVTCSFGGGSSSASAPLTGGKPATITITNAALPASGSGGCPTATRFSMTYVTVPALVPYYLTNT